MRRPPLLLVMLPLLSALACNDATSPPASARPALRNPQHMLAIPSTTPQVSVGGANACALKIDGTVTCWGTSRFGGQNVPANLGSVVQIDVGGYNSCALIANGSVTCWGGADADVGQSTTPPALGPVVQVSAGYYHTCAVKTDATVACW